MTQTGKKDWEQKKAREQQKRAKEKSSSSSSAGEVQPSGAMKCSERLQLVVDAIEVKFIDERSQL